MLAGTVLRSDLGVRYEATSLVLVAPNQQGDGGASGDRYVMSQIVALQAPQMAARVIDLTGSEMSASALLQAVTFKQLPGTDVVQIVATAPAAQEAQDLANGYLDAYVASLQDQIDEAQVPEERLLNEAIADAEGQLREIDQQVAEALAPYAPSGPDDATAAPSLDQIAPGLATERAVVMSRYTELLQRRTELEFGSQVQLGSRVVQRAELPTEPLPQPTGTVALAAPFAGLLLGALAASLLATSSNRILDATEVTSALDAPIAGIIRFDRRMRHRPFSSAEPLPDKLAAVVNELCVQAESCAVAGEPLVVVVTGTQRRAGTSTLAAAMGTRFAVLGSRVLLIDADVSQPDLSTHFGIEDDRIAALLTYKPPANRARSNARRAGPFVDTAVPNMSVVGSGAPGEQSSLRRQNVSDVVEAATRHANVVVFDAGPLRDAASSIKLAQHADAVALTVPLKRQGRRSLNVVARQLAASRGSILPVVTPALRSRGRVGRFFGNAPATAAEVRSVESRQLPQDRASRIDPANSA